MVKFERIALCLGFFFVLRIAVPDSIVVAQANGRVFADSKNKSAFDRIILKNRKVISGIVITKDHDGRTLVAVSRAWLQKNETLYPKLASESEDLERIAYTQIRERVTELLKSRVEWPVPQVLESELQRAEQWLEATDHPQSQLFFLSFPKSEILRVDSAGPSELRKAQWAWYAKLEAPESSSASSLTKLLDDEHLPWQSESPELGDRFPARPQEEKEWNARLALYQFSHVEPVTFQGTDNLMVYAKNRDAPIDMSKIVAQLMTSQLQSLLSELTGDPTSKSTTHVNSAWLRTAKMEAGKMHLNYLRATSVAADPISGEVNVDSGFALKFPDGRWEAIWTARERQDANRQTQRSIDTIANDPQIGSLKKSLAALGLGENNEQIDLAIRIGAATMHAQQEIDMQFEKLRQRYMKRLDLPLLLWDPIAISE